jgi:hypothetical protein
MDTTEDFAVRFDAVPDDAAIAVWANRRQRVDRALEAVEGVTLSAHDYFKRLVILVFANFAFRHTQFVRARGGSRRCLFMFANETWAIGPARIIDSAAIPAILWNSGDGGK